MITQTFPNVIVVTIQMLQSGQRLDYALSTLLSHYSRSQIKRWIISNKVKVNKKIVAVPKKRIVGGEYIEINNVDDYSVRVHPQDIPINVVYEDKDILVINKASNMVVHPGAGNYSGTVLNALLYRYPSIVHVQRAGIVQRLDKDTTGLMVIAKNVVAYDSLLKLFKKKKIIREYEAVVYGKFSCTTGSINQPIRRHAVYRTCMTVHAMGKLAITHYDIVEKFKMCSRIRVRLETGRTHQIRVHMTYIKHPLVGDQKYGKNVISCFYHAVYNELYNDLCFFKRQALHASMLQLYHPSTREKMCWNIPLPQDMTHLINVLRKNKILHKNN